jgi:hypothetical protein
MSSFNGRVDAASASELIQLQTFEGYWEMSDALLQVMSLDPSTARVTMPLLTPTHRATQLHLSPKIDTLEM